MNAWAVLLLRAFGGAPTAGALALLYVTTLLAGLSSAYNFYTLLGMFALGLGLWGPFLVVGVHYLFLPWTWTRRRVHRMRTIVWGLAAAPVVIFPVLMWLAGERMTGTTETPARYLFLFVLSAGIATLLIRPRRA